MKSFLVTLSQLMFAVLMYFVGAIFFGMALIPGLALFMNVWQVTSNYALLLRLFCLGTTLALGYFLFGLSLILLVGLFRTVLRLRLKEGNHLLFSKEAIKWAFISSLYLMIHYTFIDFILLTLTLHDYANPNPERAKALLATLYSLLRSGGILGVSDHIGDTGNNNSALHRMPQEQAVALAQDAGFEVTTSDLLSVHTDDHSRSIFDPRLARNTDRFLLRLQKPAR